MNWSDQDPTLFGDEVGRFDAARLTQARRIAGESKKEVGEALGVSAVAISQWESGAWPRPDHIQRLAEHFDLPTAYFIGGRAYARLDASKTHFRSLRKTPAKERDRAVAFTEQIWEVAHALEQHIELPPVDLPGFSGGESVAHYNSPEDAARGLRRAWGLPAGPIPRLVRVLERHGIIVTLAAFAGDKTATVDAFSTSHLPRPVVVLTPDRADDVYRHRFTAAHELGHLVLHGDVEPGDSLQEKEADRFAAEFLMPRDEVTPRLPARVDFNRLSALSLEWGVGVDSLVYRAHETHNISEAAYRRAFQRLAHLRKLGLFDPQPVDNFPGEQPQLLRQAFDLAQTTGLTITKLANELKIRPARVRILLGMPDDRPTLTLL